MGKRGPQLRRALSPNPELEYSSQYRYPILSQMFSFRIDDNLTLRLPEKGDAETVTAAVHKNLKRLQEWMPWAVDDYSTEHALDWIKRSRDGYAENGEFTALILHDGRFIGSIGIHDLDLVNRHASIGYWIDQDHEARGIITRCCRDLIEYLFGTMELKRVQINCAIENVRSRAVPERLGFTLEGKLRQNEILKHKSVDWAVYGLLKSEWEAGKV